MSLGAHWFVSMLVVLALADEQLRQFESPPKLHAEFSASGSVMIRGEPSVNHNETALASLSHTETVNEHKADGESETTATAKLFSARVSSVSLYAPRALWPYADQLSGGEYGFGTKPNTDPAEPNLGWKCGPGSSQNSKACPNNNKPQCLDYCQGIAHNTAPNARIYFSVAQDPNQGDKWVCRTFNSCSSVIGTEWNFETWVTQPCADHCNSCTSPGECQGQSCETGWTWSNGRCVVDCTVDASGSGRNLDYGHACIENNCNGAGDVCKAADGEGHCNGNNQCVSSYLTVTTDDSCSFSNGACTNCDGEKTMDGGYTVIGCVSCHNVCSECKANQDDCKCHGLIFSSPTATEQKACFNCGGVSTTVDDASITDVYNYCNR